MKKLIHGLIAGSICAATCLPAWATVEMDGVVLDDFVRVGGKNLKLNGAGISMRLMFKIYAMGLYLPSPLANPQEVLATEGPRRVVITILRNIRSADFQGALTSYVHAEGASLGDVAATGILQIGHALAEQTQGLNKGDQLTLDWVPGMGTLVELNRRPVTAPLKDIAVYNALLNIWLGDRPADPALKDKLLGRIGFVRAALNY